MKIKIALFGRVELIKRLDSQMAAQDDFEIIPFVYTEAKEAEQLIEQAFMCDIHVFFEPLPYLYAKEIIERRRLPVVQVTRDEYMLLMAFYRVKNYHKQPLDRVAIDVWNKHHVHEVFTELNVGDRAIHTYYYDLEKMVDINDIVAHHQHLWDDGKIDYVLTSFPEVEQHLKECGIPVFCMEIPRINLVYAINKAKSITTLDKSKSTQIVAGIIRIKNIDSIKNKNEVTAELYQLLVTFANKTHASVVQTTDNHFALVGTRGILDHITNHYRDFPLLQEIKRIQTAKVDIGFGLGLTVKQAEDHAKLALETCSMTELTSCYIVNDRQDTIGPLGVKKHFDTSRLYQALIHKARLNNELSYNFIDFITVRNNEPFSSNDVASYYRVTKRSAERTVNKLLTGEVIKVVGEEKPYLRGRPRKLFQINV